MAHLVYLARRLVEVERCCGPELEQIVEVLDELRGATDYGPPDLRRLASLCSVPTDKLSVTR